MAKLTVIVGDQTVWSSPRVNSVRIGSDVFSVQVQNADLVIEIDPEPDLFEAPPPGGDIFPPQA